MNLWTKDEIKRILTYLDSRELPFKKYTFIQDEETPKLIGGGGSSYVYEARTRKSNKKGYVIKVIGFKNQTVDSEFFNESVEVQREIGDYQDYVVRVYEHCELWIVFDEHDAIVEVSGHQPSQTNLNCLKLQFVLMEKVTPVFERTKSGNKKTTPQTLEYANEEDILKLAYDVGLALQRAHNKNILHRDVKLENVFYSEKKKQFKLGDFGIAKKTKDGFASTVAFTKGYAAPEVRGTADNDRYDKTADIYSYGMMLFVLANGLKFPDSNTYNVNSDAQYCSGYVLPRPEGTISDFLYSIIVKACMYDPDDRYQSMDEVILDIEKAMYSDRLGYRKEHKSASLVIGIVFLLVGIMTWNLTISQDCSLHFSKWEYIFALLGVAKGFLKLAKKKTVLISIIMLGVGIYLLLTMHLSIVPSLIVVFMVLSSDLLTAYVGAGFTVFGLASELQGINAISLNTYENYSWTPIVLVSLAVVLLYQYEILSFEDRKTARIIYKRGFYWIIVCLLYMAMILIGVTGTETLEQFIKTIFRMNDSHVLSTINWKAAGITGLLFCLYWIGRERVLLFIEKRRG